MDSDTAEVEQIITEDTEETVDPQETAQEQQLETVAEVQENTPEGATTDSAELDESESFTKGPQVSTDHLNSEDDPDNEQVDSVIVTREHAHILNSTENNVTSENTNTDASLSNANKKRKKKRKKKKKSTETSQQEISEPSQPEQSVNKNKENTERLIAELCLRCPNVSMRKHIQLYEYGKSVQKIEQKFSQLKNEQLSSLLSFLNNGKVGSSIPTLKKDLVHDIVCRIQNLLPDICGFCNETYALGFDEDPIMPCASCFQSSHKPCILALVNKHLKLQLTADTLTSAHVSALVNPFKIPGINFLCKPCDETKIAAANKEEIIIQNRTAPAVAHIQHDADGLYCHTTMLPNVLISSSTPQPTTASATQSTTIAPIIAPTTASSTTANATATANTGVTTANTGVVNSTRSWEHPTNQEATNVDQIIILPNPDSQGFTGISDPRRSTNQAPTDGSNSREGNQETRERKIDIVCRFYDKGNCLHGITGDTCRYLHTELCRKFTRHGTRQPRGCKLGARCKYFHPTMCLSSLRRGQCFHDQCSYRHVEGTQRIRPSDTSTNQSTPPSQHSHNQNLSSQHHRNESYPTNTMQQQRTQHQGNQHPHQHSPHSEQINSINQHQDRYIPQERNFYQHGNHHPRQHSSQHAEQNRENQQQHIESSQNQRNPGNETASTDHFLELFRHLKAELWTKMNTQFNVLTSQMDQMKASLHGPTLAREQPQKPQAQEPQAQQHPQYALSQSSLSNQQQPSNYQQPQIQFQAPAKIQAPTQIQTSGQTHPSLLYSQVAAQQEVQQKTQQIPLQQYYQYQQTTPFNQIRPMQIHAQC